jgi:hypothetical protein
MYQTNIFTSMIIATLSTIAKICHLSRCPTNDEGLMKFRYVFTMEYQLLMKRMKSYRLWQNG